MKLQPILVGAAMVAFLACTGCSISPGRPGKESEVIPPNEVTDFNLLYAQNCAGCHGADGKGGAAIAMANPVFLAKPEALNNVTPPPYSSRAPGDAQRDADAYRTYCSSCHGADGRGGSKASSIVDGSYLALVSDQYLRTIVIAGRPELGAPDWRGDVRGRHMSAQEISDVVAWLSSHRIQFPGQPYPISADRAKGEPR